VKSQCLLVCRFSAAGNDDLTTRSGDRRPKTCTEPDFMQRSKSILTRSLRRRAVGGVWHLKTECSRRLEVDRQLELDWSLDRQLARLTTNGRAGQAWGAPRLAVSGRP
jgi:hypothetical protein